MAYTLADLDTSAKPAPKQYTVADMAPAQEKPSLTSGLPEAAINAAFAGIPGLSSLPLAAKAALWAKANPDKATKLLPAAGAAALTIVAPEVGIPAEIGLAGLGGGGGEGFRQIIDRLRGAKAPETSTEAAKDIGVEGAKQAAAQAGGIALNKGFEAVGERMLKPALGFTKRFLNKANKLRDVENASKTIADAGVITAGADADKILESVKGIQNRSGEEIGAFLRNQGGGLDATEAADRVLSLKSKFQDDPQAIAKINTAVKAIFKNGKARGNSVLNDVPTAYEPIPFQRANELKGYFQSRGNFKNYPDASEVDRQIAGVFRGALDDSLEQASTLSENLSGFEKFISNKKLYQAANKAEEGLMNRISSEQGNRAIGLTDIIAGAGAAGAGLAHGGNLEAILGTAGVLALKKVGDKYGPQAAVQLGRAVLKNPQVVPQIIRLAGAGIKEAKQ